ncbi:MAG: putative aminohydrolase SsnA [Candidatus Hodarchaeales archaeon]|jgi:putative selenium metabolism protein SsnA
MTIYINNATILTMNPSNEVINDGALVIEGNKIEKVGLSKDLDKDYSSCETVIDAFGKIVLPGMTCGHMHFYSAFATGMPLPPFPKGFVEVLENLWWKLDKALLKDAVYYSALLGYLQAVKHGTTTVIDHHASPSYISGSLNLIEKAAREINVRSNLCYEVTDRNGHEEAIEGLKENEEFIKKHHNNQDKLVTGLLGLHASFTLEDTTLELAKEITKKYDTGVHIHVAEGKADVDHAKKNFNITPVKRLDKFELLNNKSVLAHCIHVEEGDYAILKQNLPNIMHQPRSNMNNAVGTLDIWKLLDNSIPFGLGTDGMSADMKAELIVGALIHKHQGQNNTIGSQEVVDALFKVNPKVVNRLFDIQTGKIMEKNQADVIISNYFPKSPVDDNNVTGHILFGTIHESINTTIVDGRIVYQDNKLMNVNEPDIMKKAQGIAVDTWNRLN